MNTAAMQSERKDQRQSYLGLCAATILVGLPVIFFYVMLLRTALNIPYSDDYHAVLEFTNQFIQLQGFPAKASYFLASQHNEYKLYFGQGVVWLQFALLGHIDFRLLAAIGNGFILLLGIFFWRIFLPEHKDLGRRLALFVPISWLLFQLQYIETLNFSMAGLQNLPILVFSFACIYFLLRKTRGALCGALAFYVLAIASSGNGFLLFPVAVLVLVLGRRYAHLLSWAAVTGISSGAYAYHYNSHNSGVSYRRGIFNSLLHLRPAYAISFMGSALGIPFPVAASFVLGGVLCAFFAWMAYRGYIRRNPLVSCCVLFLLLTAIGVAGIRSELGVMQSLSSRYTIYSALLLIFAWIVIVEEFLQHSSVPLLNHSGYLGAVAVAVLFSLSMDAIGWAMIQQRDLELVQGMTAFEHPASAHDSSGPLSTRQETLFPGFNPYARIVLQDSIRLGVYRPPILRYLP
jgi:hypothetical protein